jgi:hypothetical protein
MVQDRRHCIVDGWSISHSKELSRCRESASHDNANKIVLWALWYRFVKTNFAHLLLGKDLRKLKSSREVIEAVQNQETFDELFALVFHHERSLVMRAADTVEKVTRRRAEYLHPHKEQLLSVLKMPIIKN